MNSLPNLHDATLENLKFDWQTARLHLKFSTGVAESDVIIVEARDVTNLNCPRLLPWGPSDSVNCTKLERLNDGHVLMIEMQSGDVLEVSCSGIIWKPISGETRDA